MSDMWEKYDHEVSKAVKEQFSGPNQQIQSQGSTVTTIQYPIPPGVKQHMFVPGLLPHDHTSPPQNFHGIVRFGINEDDEEDMTMNDVLAVQETQVVDDGEVINVDEVEPQVIPSALELSHSLPAHLGLDPTKMNEMRMLMFLYVGDGIEDFNQISSYQKSSFGKEHERPPLNSSSQRRGYKSDPPGLRKNPLRLLEHTPGNLATSPPEAIVLSQKKTGMPLKVVRPGGFKLDISHETPVTAHNSHKIVDAGRFMGRSFRVGWGPNDVLVHTGAPVSNKFSPKEYAVNVLVVGNYDPLRTRDYLWKGELIQGNHRKPELVSSLSSMTMEKATIHNLTVFFVDKLTDLRAQRDALVGCLALMRRKGDVGMVTIGDAKAVIQSFKKNLYVQTLGQHDRMFCFELLECLLNKYPKAVMSLGNCFFSVERESFRTLDFGTLNFSLVLLESGRDLIAGSNVLVIEICCAIVMDFSVSLTKLFSIFTGDDDSFSV